MIIVNGCIRRKLKSGGGLDPATGYPVAPSAAWSDPIPCQFVPTKQNLQAKADGEPVTTRTYAIYLEGYTRCEVCVGEQISLSNECGLLIGEYSVRSITPLLAVDQTRLDV